jgi:hypothetical protein
MYLCCAGAGDRVIEPVDVAATTKQFTRRRRLLRRLVELTRL